jgi:hypothetical protein
MTRKDMLTEELPGENEFVDSIPAAPTAGQWQRSGRRPAKRNRNWEKTHRPYRYVNVPIEVREQITALGEHLVVTADEVARALLDYSLACLEDGRLNLTPRPNPQGRKMTLFPREQARGWEEAETNPKEIPARRNRKSRSEKKVYPAVSYRLPEGLHEQLCGVAIEFEVPLGEIVANFLGFGLRAYKKGQLTLQPHPVTVRMALNGGRA